MKKTQPKRKSKGKRHPVYARSLDKIADSITQGVGVASALRLEAQRIRKIVR